MKASKKHFYIFLNQRGVEAFATHPFLKSFVQRGQYLKSRSADQKGYFLEAQVIAESEKAGKFLVDVQIPLGDVGCILSSPINPKKPAIGFEIDDAITQ